MEIDAKQYDKEEVFFGPQHKKSRRAKMGSQFKISAAAVAGQIINFK